jgi:hypothetical protein
MLCELRQPAVAFDVCVQYSSCCGGRGQERERWTRTADVNMSETAEGIPCAYRYYVEKVGDPRFMVWACRFICCVTGKPTRGRTIDVGSEDGAGGGKY